MHVLPFCPLCGERIDLEVPGRCPSCGAAHYRNARPTAGGLLVDRGRALLLRRNIDPWRGRWDIPGGFCEGAELPQDAVVRELHEEIGVRARITALLGMWLDTYHLDDITFDTLNTYYLLDAGPDPELVLDEEENSEARWVTPAEVAEIDIAFPSHQPDVVAAWVAHTAR